MTSSPPMLNGRTNQFARDEIATISFRAVLNSRGEKTVEATVTTSSGARGQAIAPSGASTGQFEAVELPVSDAITAARQHVEPALVHGIDVLNQRKVDTILRDVDGTGNFSKIGANSAVSTSMAVSKAAADSLSIPLFKYLGGAFRGTDESFPVPLGNVIGGGAHAANSTDFQEFLAVPVGAPTIREAVFANASVHALVGSILAEREIPAAMGDEGGWAAAIDDDTAFQIVQEALEEVGREVGFEIRLGIDPAATELYDAEAEVYRYSETDRTQDEQIEYISTLIEKYELVFVEDPLDEGDFEGFSRLMAGIDSGTLVCGDDLFVTNVERLRRGIQLRAGNSILIKPNQIGTVSDTIDAIELATKNGFDSVISHRSGETEDATIAHLAVATNADFIKAGAVGGERTAKLNELVRIDDHQ